MNGMMLMGGATSRPWAPCPRHYSGNMCGIYLPYLPPIPGGAGNSSLLLTWLADRYPADIQRRARADYQQVGFTDWLMSWPDSRAIGKTPQQFGDDVWARYQDGLEPAVMLVSKDYDGPTLDSIKANVAPVLPFLKERCGRICVGWELNSVQPFKDFPIQLQQFIDWLAPQITPWGGKLYVHFTAGVSAWEIDGTSFAAFWNANIGKLTGVLWQADVEWPTDFLQAKAKDILDRFAGGFNCSPDSGFGHPFDCIGLELQADYAFHVGWNTTFKQNQYSAAVVNTPATVGPFGPVVVLGSGNGVA